MIDWSPPLPLAVTLLLAALLVTGAALAVVRAPRHAPPRVLIALVGLALLAAPVRRIEEREPARDVALALVDRSASMSIDLRGRDADAALGMLRAASPGVEWRVTEVRPEVGAGTRLAPTLDRALRDVPAERLAGVVLLTDGLVRDADALARLAPGRPVHALVAGDPGLRDRRLIVTRVPPYSVTGSTARVTLRVDDGPQAGEAARIDWSIDGAAQPPVSAAPGGEVTLRVPVARRGAIEVAIGASPLPGGEATLVNNRALVRLNGVRDRLRVLLVSGVPYPGGRAWRDILKSDPNIDLVHFTILRLPDSYDPTPSDELALIPFPVEELFEERLPGFDLVVLDRFGLTELLSPVYFARLSDYVQRGGGLFVVTGDEFAGQGSVANTAVRDVLPAVPAGPTLTRRFTPERTDIGRRHPVTDTLAGGWGAWGAQADVRSLRGQVLMRGIDGRPLLLLSRQGRGRVGMLASTDLWWWGRDVAGPGPQEELLRRVSHWLMQEPDLAENRLDVRADGRRVTIAARAIEPPAQALLTGPDGDVRGVALSRREGVGSASVVVPRDGLYRVEAGGLRRSVLAGDVAELDVVRPTLERLRGLSDATGGRIAWLRDGVPDVRRVAPGARATGAGWMGLVENDGGRLVGLRESPLVPPAVMWVLLTALVALAWWRERA
jgi:hypothetical protein